VLAPLAGNLDRKDDLKDEDVYAAAQDAARETGLPLPTLGKQIFAGWQDRPTYDQAVTVGVMTILKLHHLVEDKVHAVYWSIQPGDSAAAGRKGAVWWPALWRDGSLGTRGLRAAYTLQEMLTVKSDDVRAVNTYEAIVKASPLRNQHPASSGAGQGTAIPGTCRGGHQRGW